MTTSIEIALKLVYEAFKILHKEQSEKFEKEWENDKQKIIKCLEAGDADCINLFIAKYSDL
jgi:hypothetical protein